MIDQPAVHFVDDESALRDALGFLLHSHGVPAKAYASGPELLDTLSRHRLRGCILLDVRMEPMSGLQVHDQLILQGVQLPVLFLSGHGDIPMAVEALQRGALDFLEKPFVGDVLIQRLQRALAIEAAQHAERQAQQALADRLASLTEREREIMTLVAAGKLNKVIADELGVSMRTVEVHRSRVYDKLGIRSSAEAATLLARLGKGA
jgi:two-component system response regulator DctR